MRAGGGRAKGAGFERLVAKIVVAAFRRRSFDVSNKDCYRTPLSGGHRYSRETDPGDLMMTPRMHVLFPFVVECKHHRNFRINRLLVVPEKRKKTWAELSFIVQAAEQAKNACPLLIARGNNTPIYAIFPHSPPCFAKNMDDAAAYDRGVRRVLPRLYLGPAVVGGFRWSAALLDQFLAAWVDSLPRRRVLKFEKLTEDGV